MNSGYDHHSTVISLAKQLLSQCAETRGEITLPRETIKILCETLIANWTGRQQAVVKEFKKVPNA